jgi:hypothetical protein
MGATLPRPNMPVSSQPARDTVPRRLIVTASVVVFAITDWQLWVLLRDGPWGPPMRLVLGNESVADAVDRTIEALLMWPSDAQLFQLKAGWQEQQVYVWGSSEQGAAISLTHCVLLRANRDELRPNLSAHPVPSLRVSWAPVAEVEGGQRALDVEALPGLQAALHTLRSYVQRSPEVVLQYLADMAAMSMPRYVPWWEEQSARSKETRPLSILREPPPGDGTLTLAEATLLYRAFFPPDEPIDLSNLRRRFLGMNCLTPIDEERPVRGRELDWRRVSRAYRYKAKEVRV